MTPAQRSKIFAVANERGLSLDDVRAMTPAGSVSALTRVHATALIDALEKGQSPDYDRAATKRPRRDRPAEGSIRLVSDAQRNTIESLRRDCGFTKESFQTWLSQRSFNDRRPLTDMNTSGDAIFIIELLKRVRDKQRAAQRKAVRHG